MVHNLGSTDFLTLALDSSLICFSPCCSFDRAVCTLQLETQNNDHKQ